MLICVIIDYFFNNSKMTYTDYAKIGQYAENVYWDKSFRNDGSDGMCSWWSGSLRLADRNDLKYSKLDFSYGKLSHW